ncbi:MAG: hypothetical protein CSB06_02685 [Bacteroidia bacterium]|nr:MAG: hypothetical protein CSB06_02685 [Bacteroidia bacterium]
MDKEEMTKELFVLRLHDIEAIKFGEFTLKSGLKSPFYINIRDMISYPRILNGIAKLIADKVQHLQFDYIAGIPYTALPIATLVADILDKSLIYMRKEEKSYGTKSNIIGKFKKGEKCLIIDDLITTGESMLETAEKFREAGLQVLDFAVIIDRSQNGEEIMQQHGYRLHSFVNVNEIIQILEAGHRISRDQASAVKRFTENMYSGDFSPKAPANKLTNRLLEIMHQKKSNLILSLDANKQADFFNLLDQTADHIAMLKTHIDILSDFDETFIPKLKQYAEKYNFLIFEDRKFADIGNTVRQQFQEGIFKIKDWADCVTIHTIPGEMILESIFDKDSTQTAFLLAKMSSKGNLMNENYTRKVFEMGEKHPNIVSGYICHARNKTDLRRLKNKIPKGQLLLMPGVKLNKDQDAKGQQYTSLEDAVKGGADCIIVGRGIIESNTPGDTARMYKEKAWELYEAQNTPE